MLSGTPKPYSHNEMNKYHHTDAASIPVLGASFTLSVVINGFCIFAILQKYTN